MDAQSIRFSGFFSLYRICRDRLFHLNLLVVVLVLLPAVSTEAQFKFRKAPNRQDPGSLSEFHEKQLWADFLYARNIGNFTLSGALRYRPARSSSKAYLFNLLGEWHPNRQFSKLSLTDGSETNFDREVVIRGEAAYAIAQKDDCTRETLIDEASLSIPLMDQLPFTWNDILMPYLFWDDVVYMGPDRYLGRPAHKYVVSNNDEDAAIASVIVTLDEDYAVLLKSDVLDKDDNILKRIRVSGFKQFNKEWMFSELVWEHRQSRESVLLKVSDFSIDQ